MTRNEYAIKRHSINEIRAKFATITKEYNIVKSDYDFLTMCERGRPEFDMSIIWYVDEPIFRKRGSYGSTRYEFSSPFSDVNRSAWTYFATSLGWYVGRIGVGGSESYVKTKEEAENACCDWVVNGSG